MKRSDVPYQFGDTFNELNELQKSVVYGLYLGGSCDQVPKSHQFYKPNSISRKDRCTTGVALIVGLGCEENVSKAVELWKMASLSFEANSIFFLGLVQYYDEQGDKKVAVEYFKNAKEKGQLEATYWLGMCYLEGEGVEEDALKAADCFVEGSSAKHMRARYALAKMYWEGKGTSLKTGIQQDFVKALKLFKEAFEGGELCAKEYIESGFKNGLCLENGEQKKEKKKEIKEDVSKNYVLRERNHFSKKIVYGNCNRCAKKLNAHDLKGMCKQCENVKGMIKNSATYRECSMCFVNDERLFQINMRDICIVCGNDPVKEKNEETALLIKEKGNEFFKKCKYKEACRYYEKGIEYANLFVLHSNLIAALFLCQQFYKCWTECNEMIHNDSQNSTILVLCGRSCRELGLFDEAKKRFEEAVKCNEKVREECEQELMVLNDVKVISTQMAANVVVKNFNEALMCYLRAPERLKSNQILRFAKLDVDFRMSHFEDVSREAPAVLLLDLLDDYKAHVIHIQSVSLLYTSLNPSVKELIEKLDHALLLSSSKSEDRRGIEESCTKLKKLNAYMESEDAVVSLMRIETLDPQLTKCERFGMICLSFAQKCMSKKKIVEAVEIGVKATLFPKLTEECLILFERAAKYAFEQKDYDNSIRYYTLCREISFPPSESVLYGRACAYQKKGMYVEALEDFTKLTELRPSSNQYTEARDKARHSAIVPKYYLVLGVAFNSTSKEIKKAFKRLALATHPDKTNNLEDSTTRFREISEAYITLSDPEKRKQYDIENEI